MTGNDPNPTEKMRPLVFRPIRLSAVFREAPSFDKVLEPLPTPSQ